MKESIYLPRLAEILSTRHVTAREKLFEVRMKDGAPLGHDPGQFVMVSVFGVGEAPISVSSSPTRPDASFEMCIRSAGSVTGALHALEPGATIGIRGPFGRGYPAEEMKGHDLLFVAGGLGLAPLRSMINYAVDKRGDYGDMSLLYGARTPADILFVEELDRWSKSEAFCLRTTVDIADLLWTGRVGVITHLLDRVRINPRETFALVVGPPAMFRFVLKSVLSLGVSESRIYLSLERRMKCGVGKCGHCQMDYVYVCQKGPVFSYTKVRQLKEAF
jgi:NAD(P)H-flavin reductase